MIMPYTRVKVSNAHVTNEFKSCLEIHLSKLRAPFDKESRTDVEMELGKCVSPLRLVKIISRQAMTGGKKSY